MSKSEKFIVLPFKKVRGNIAPGEMRAIIGPNGILAWGDYSRQLKQREGELRSLHAQKAALENRVKLLDPRKADPDMVDELVRKQLGVTHPDEVVVPLN